MEFQELNRENLNLLRPYFRAQKLHISAFSAGFQLMWGDLYKMDFAFAGDCLILKEEYEGKLFFHYPLSLSGDGAQESAALDQIEAYCRDQGIPLCYENVPASRRAELTARYADYTVKNDRRWRDYLYAAQDFVTYAGRKFSGQRNHVNKFHKLYPTATFRAMVPGDEPRILAFLKQFESRQLNKNGKFAVTEMKGAEEIVSQLQDYGLLCGYMEHAGEIISVSIGERCGDTLVIHVEKAFTAYAGLYPATAQAFAALFAQDAAYINREDDAGDLGLRKSKLQYNPVELVDKYSICVFHPLQRLEELPCLHTERLTLRPVEARDLSDYARLAGDVERNRYWGYDYREDLPNGDGAALLELTRSLWENRQELYLGLYAGDKLVGEGVLHRFGYRGACEVGVRLLPEYEGQGYATEGVRALCDYAFAELDMERVEAKCFRENVKSRAMLLKSGMRETEGDATFFRFYKTAQL